MGPIGLIRPTEIPSAEMAGGHFLLALLGGSGNFPPMQAIPQGVTVVEHPLVRVKLTRLRDERTEPGEFRALLAELALLLTMEATRDFSTRPCKVRTPLDDYEGAALTRPVVIVPILRAGLGRWTGCCGFFPARASGTSA